MLANERVEERDSPDLEEVALKETEGSIKFGFNLKTHVMAAPISSVDAFQS